jgi:hypothetical protein
VVLVAETRWGLNDVSVSEGSSFASSNGSYALSNAAGGTLSRTTSSPSPYEGDGCYQGSQTSDDVTQWNFYKFNSGLGVYEDMNGQSCWVDVLVYLDGSTKYATPVVTGNDSSFQYTWVQINTELSTFGIYTFESFGFPQSQTRAVSAPGVVPTSGWCRLLVVLGTKGPVAAQLFTGNNLLEDIPNSAITWSSSTLSNYSWLRGGAGNSGTYFDDIILNDTTSPNRSASTSTYKLGYGISRY